MGDDDDIHSGFNEGERLKAPSSAMQSLRVDTKGVFAKPKLVKVSLRREVLKEQPPLHQRLCTCPQCGLEAPTQAPIRRRLVDYPKIIWLSWLVPYGTFLLILLYYLTRSVADVSLPLCESCQKRDSKGRIIRRLGMFGALFIPVATIILVAGLDLGFAVSAYTICASFVAGLTSAYAAERQTRFDVFAPTKLDKHLLTAKVPETWLRVLREEAPEVLDESRD